MPSLKNIAILSVTTIVGIMAIFMITQSRRTCLPSDTDSALSGEMQAEPVASEPLDK